MKKLFLLFLALCVLAGLSVAPTHTLHALVALAIILGVAFLAANIRRDLRRSALRGATNDMAPNFGTTSNGKTLLSTAAIATKYLIVKFGADYRHFAALAATADEPIGILPDEVSGAEEEGFIELLGLTNRTVNVVASAALALGIDLYATADGKVSAKPTAAGTYWRVGKSLQPADGANDVIEMLPMRPRKLIVVSALESTNGTAAGASASLANLAAETEKLGDDARKIAVALNGDADVALATT